MGLRQRGLVLTRAFRELTHSAPDRYLLLFTSRQILKPNQHEADVSGVVGNMELKYTKWDGSKVDRLFGFILLTKRANKVGT